MGGLCIEDSHVSPRVTLLSEAIQMQTTRYAQEI